MQAFGTIGINGGDGNDAPVSEETVVEETKDEPKSPVSDDLKDDKTEVDEVEVTKSEEEEEPDYKSLYEKEKEESEKRLKALRDVKKSYRTLKSDKKEDKPAEKETPVDGSEWDEDSSRFQKETLTKAEQAAQAVLEKSNEKSAINQFLGKYEELADNDDLWQDIVTNYTPKRGRDTVEDIVKDLESARIVTLHERGELDSSIEKARNSGLEEGKKKRALAEMALTPGRPGASKSDTKAPSKGSVDMAKRFRHDPKVVDAIDLKDTTVSI